MRLDLVVAQLRQFCPPLGGRVAGAAEFVAGLEADVWPKTLPAAYVVPLDDEAEANDVQNSVRQVVHERVGIVVLFDNSGDRRGQGVTLQYEPVRAALFGALLNWNAESDRACGNMAYGGGQLLEMDRARLFYQWNFVLPVAIDESDGFNPSWPPLTEIDANTDPGDPPFAARAVLDQGPAPAPG